MNSSHIDTQFIQSLFQNNQFRQQLASFMHNDPNPTPSKSSCKQEANMIQQIGVLITDLLNAQIQREMEVLNQKFEWTLKQVANIRQLCESSICSASFEKRTIESETLDQEENGGLRQVVAELEEKVNLMTSTSQVQLMISGVRNQIETIQNQSIILMNNIERNFNKKIDNLELMNSTNHSKTSKTMCNIMESINDLSQNHIQRNPLGKNNQTKSTSKLSSFFNFKT